VKSKPHVVAFDMGTSVIGVYLGYRRRCEAFFMNQQHLTALVSLLYEADVIITFSADTRSPDYDRYSLEQASLKTDVAIDMARIARTYIDVRGLVWQSEQRHFGQGLKPIYRSLHGEAPANVRNMSRDEYVAGAQLDAFMAYRLWRWLQRRPDNKARR